MTPKPRPPRTAPSKLPPGGVRSSTRRSTVENKRAIEHRQKEAEARRATFKARPVKRIKTLTQDALIREALEIEEENTQSLLHYLEQEEERKTKQRQAGKKEIQGPFLRWISVGLNQNVFAARPDVPDTKPAVAAETSAADSQTSTTTADVQTSTTATQTTASDAQTPAADVPTSAPDAQVSDNHTQSSAADATTSAVDTQTPAPDATTSATNTQAPATDTQTWAAHGQASAVPKAEASPSTTCNNEPPTAPSDTNSATTQHAPSTSVTEAHPSGSTGSISTITETPGLTPSTVAPTTNDMAPAHTQPSPATPTQSIKTATPSKLAEVMSYDTQSMTDTSSEEKTARTILSLEQLPPDSTWVDEFRYLLGDQCAWNHMPIVPSRNRPFRPRQSTCVITGLPARYRDPHTGIPYATIDAYATLRRVLEGAYMYTGSPRTSAALSAGCFGLARGDEGAGGVFRRHDT